MRPLDLRRHRLIKLWRVTGAEGEITVLVVRSMEGEYVGFARFDIVGVGRRIAAWRGQRGRALSEREGVHLIYAIERVVSDLPGVRLRIDVPFDVSEEQQVLILLDQGLIEFLAPAAVDAPWTIQRSP